MKKLILGMVTFSIIIGLGACSSNEKSKSITQKNSEAQAINVVTGGEIDTLDSALYTDIYSSDIIGDTTEGLYRNGKGNSAELAMAKTEPKISTDGKTYTFTLRNAKWSNGDTVTANDFVYAFQNVVDPAYKSSSSNQMDIIKNAEAIRNGKLSLEELGVKALDDKTLELTLEYPAPYLPKLLTGTPFTAKNAEFAKKLGNKYGTTSENVVYNGAFIVKGWNGTNDSWTLEKNPHYWDAKNVKIEKVKMNVVKEISTAANLFDSKKVDFTVLSDTYVRQYRDSKNFHSVSKALEGYIGFNTQREIFANVHARRAVAQAFDKAAYTKNILADGSKPLDGMVPDQFSKGPDGKEFRRSNGNLLKYDVKAAKSEWKKAKEELGKETIELELLTADAIYAKKTAEFLQSELENNLSGLKIKIKSVPVSNRLAMNRAGDFDFFFGTYTPNYADPINFLEMYVSSGGLNFGKFSNEEYDQGIKAIKSTLATDPSQRWQKMLEVEKVGMEEAAIAPVYQGAIAYLQADKVNGIQVFPLGRQISYRQVYISNEK